MASRKKVGFGSGLAVGAILLLLVTVFFNNIVSDLKPGRFDLTEGKVYTISQGAKNILGRLDVPVQIKYYVTKQDEMPGGLKTLQQEVTDKLNELSIASGGRLQYMVVDPKETEELEDALIQKGVRPFQVQSVERDAVAVKLVYSALAIGYKDKQDEIIPQLLPESIPNLEYELVSKVLKITREKDPVVAVYSTKEPIDPEMARIYLQLQQPIPEPQDNFAATREYLRASGYDVRDIQITKESPIPDEAATVVLLGVRELNDRQRYEIHRVLERGGNLIVAAQALLYDYNPGPRGGFNINVRSQKLGINALLSSYGVRIDDRMLLDAQMATLAIPRTTTVGGLRFQMTEPIQAPMQIRVMGEGVNRDLPLTAGVPEVLYLWGTQLILDDEALGNAGLSLQPIMIGSDRTWTVEKKSGSVTRADLDPEQHETSPHPYLAVLLEGVFPDPWEGKEIPKWPSETTPAPGEPGADGDEAADADEDEETAEGASDGEAPAEAAAVGATGNGSAPAPGRLLVLGCAKMFEDMLLDQQAHSLLLLNSVDALSLGEDVIRIRSKVFERRTIADPSDGKKLAFRLINMALVPVAAVIFGLTRWAIRRREEDEYLMRHAGAGGGRK